ncbi:MAG: hypothetical protein GY711_00305 [bacterium]|nr:hypothetical protein [bacterium]
MSKPRGSWIGLVLAVALACGCRVSHPEHDGYWIRNYNPGERAEHRPAPYSGEYVLHARPPVDDPAGDVPTERAEVFARTIEAGDAVGFELENEVLFAVTGDERTALDSSRYCWHIRPGTGPDMTTIRTRSFVRLVVGIVAVAALVGGGLQAAF